MTIATQDVRWAAGGRMIVDGVTLQAAPGRMLGLLGPNGAGKSTLLRLICRLRRVESGVITLGGADIAGLPRAAIARRVALVEQQAATDMQVSVLDVVRLGRTPHRAALASWSGTDEAAVNEALARVGLTERHDQFWHTLSGGERQRVHIARALAQEPSELILDEPTNHLDIQHQLSILSLVRRLGITCIMALHDLNLAAMFCDEIALLHEGQLQAAGAPDEVLTAEAIQRIFGVAVSIGTGASGRRHIEYLIEPERRQS